MCDNKDENNIPEKNCDGVKKMDDYVLDVLQDFINKNRVKLYETARSNTIFSTEGKAIISKTDEWFEEDVWDELYKNQSD